MSRNQTIDFTYENDEGEEITAKLPAEYEVCSRCQGRGTHVNPNIDGHGISEDEWNGPDWDEDSRQTYLSGGYDVTCEECRGLRVVLVVDESRCDKSLLERYLRARDAEAADAREDAAIRRMECGIW